MHFAQEGLFLLIAACPALHDGDLATVRQAEAADVDGIAIGMFG